MNMFFLIYLLKVAATLYSQAAERSLDDLDMETYDRFVAYMASYDVCADYMMELLLGTLRGDILDEIEFEKLFRENLQIIHPERVEEYIEQTTYQEEDFLSH